MHTQIQRNKCKQLSFTTQNTLRLAFSPTHTDACSQTSPHAHLKPLTVSHSPFYMLIKAQYPGRTAIVPPVLLK